MDLVLIFLIIASLASLSLSLLAKDTGLKAAAKKVFSVLVAILLIYTSYVQFFGDTDVPVVPDPGPEITDPIDAPDPVPDPQPLTPDTDPSPNDGTETQLDEHGTYDSKEDVALFIHLYGRLPDNYITKNEAEKLGWSGGSLERYAPGKCIGGSRFYNNEKKLPEKNGRKYYECDIDTLGKKSRGAKRIIYSDDGLIYYTSDHYETFQLLYGEE
ncbi:MAG: hypothetical protein IJF87_05680 [Erysipelotrichaceae bacterium]|nr:hypothetical protein [Erysipelotrichaceae bacterium]MBQ3412468.1 ribonuclease [Oscillospiraceae bacterium]